MLPPTHDVISASVTDKMRKVAQERASSQL
jgi:hypothetical protein